MPPNLWFLFYGPNRGQSCSRSHYRLLCPIMIPTHRRLEYASGYLTLGLLREAATELSCIQGPEAQSAPVLHLRVDLYHQSEQWPQLAQIAETLAQLVPKKDQGWISWAFALRELNRVEEAREVLLSAELLHGKTSAVLHYNLACYACLLGDRQEAMRRLIKACAMDEEFRQGALDDPDLKPLWDVIAAMP